MWNYKFMKCYGCFVIYKGYQIICYRRLESDAIKTMKELGGF